MESRPWWRWALPGPLAAPWLLGLLLCPWTLRPTGMRFPSHVLLVLPRRAAFICPPPRPPEQLIPVWSGGICWLRLNTADFTGEAFGTRRCLANASPRWLLKRWEQRSPSMLC